MTRRTLFAPALAAVALLLLAAPASAVPSDKQVADVVGADGEPVGTARLSRTAESLSAHLKVGGLQRNDTFTVWAMVTDPGEAGPDIGFAGGGVVNGGGQLHLKVELEAGDLAGFPAELGMASGDGLDDPRGATVTFVLRSHGPAVPGLVAEQTTTFMGGCNYALVPALTPGSYGAPGAFACADLFTATFEPPVA